jgi:4-hydroxy-tetrahydrodipicolinate reductase
MNIALIGYGKMGKEIEKAAIERGHHVKLIIDKDNIWDLNPEKLSACDVAIEFTTPESAVENIYSCFKANTPVVIGTTGWVDQMEEVKSKCLENGNTMLAASNFSIGVNIFFELNRKLATLMNPQEEYEVKMEEIHHIHKKDAPSGTAISLAQDIINIIERKNEWKNEASSDKKDLIIISKREDNVPGTHSIKYTSEVDDIEIIHTAHSRKGFALGAVIAAEWIANKKGVFSMSDVLKISN